MNPKPLTPDLTAALHAAGDEPLSVIDEATQHVYVVVDMNVHQRAMQALHQQNVDSIRKGVESMEAGEGMSIDESQHRIEEAIRKFAS